MGETITPIAGKPSAGRYRLPVALLVASAGAVIALAGCSSGAPTSSGTALRRPLPAGSQPSEIAKMVCQREAQREINETLGVTASVSKPTWVDHVYSCFYRYPDGEFELTIKELSSWPQTTAYFASIGHQQGRSSSIPNLGQGAYQTANGSTVVRKDWKILTVNISGRPARFGKPPTSRGDVAVTVADLILACWAGD
jgi:hypothetical protein